MWLEKTERNLCVVHITRSARVSSEEMSHKTCEFWTEQEFVYVDVGRRPFRVPSRIVQRYPESVVAAMLTEFPEFGRENDPLSVDYDVSTSKWNVYVYRCGSRERISCGTEGSLEREMVAGVMNVTRAPCSRSGRSISVRFLRGKSSSW